MLRSGRWFAAAGHAGARIWTSQGAAGPELEDAPDGISYLAWSPKGPTLAAACVVIAAVALLSLVDPTAWLTRLAGLAAVVVFAMFAVQVFRHHGENFSTSYQALRPGAWSELGAGVLLLLGGLIRYRRKSSTRPEIATQAVTERGALSRSTRRPFASFKGNVDAAEFIRLRERVERLQPLKTELATGRTLSRVHRFR